MPEWTFFKANFYYPWGPNSMSCRAPPWCETLAGWYQSCKRRLSASPWWGDVVDEEFLVPPIEGLKWKHKEFSNKVVDEWAESPPVILTQGPKNSQGTLHDLVSLLFMFHSVWYQFSLFEFWWISWHSPFKLWWPLASRAPLWCALPQY